MLSMLKESIFAFYVAFSSVLGVLAFTADYISEFSFWKLMYVVDVGSISFKSLG